MSRFETTTCTRCGGSGKFSFNLMDGDKCYGCHGTGLKLTKRGSAARNMFIESCRKPIEEIEVGNQLWDDTYGLRAKWMLVTQSKESDTIINGQRGWEVATKRSTFSANRGCMVRSVTGKEELDAKIAAALAYQATLTQAGKPAKHAAQQAEHA